jgi:hypothetical protein
MSSGQWLPDSGPGKQQEPALIWSCVVSVALLPHIATISSVYSHSAHTPEGQKSQG